MFLVCHLVHTHAHIRKNTGTLKHINTHIVLAMRTMTGTDMARCRFRQSRSRYARPGNSMLPRAKGTENMIPTTLRCRTLLASIAVDTRRESCKRSGFKGSGKGWRKTNRYRERNNKNGGEFNEGKNKGVKERRPN